ncbi:MAG: hypothetical protein HY903_18065 [Deltaproteobacteria bacterium]|nr:hypothetical protein [Deltaproteobacteria bacterium]
MLRFTGVVMVLVVAASGCLVSVPEPNGNQFACNDNSDCGPGFFCDGQQHGATGLCVEEQAQSCTSATECTDIKNPNCIRGRCVNQCLDGGCTEVQGCNWDGSAVHCGDCDKGFPCNGEQVCIRESTTGGYRCMPHCSAFEQACTYGGKDGWCAAIKKYGSTTSGDQVCAVCLASCIGGRTCQYVGPAHMVFDTIAAAVECRF